MISCASDGLFLTRLLRLPFELSINLVLFLIEPRWSINPIVVALVIHSVLLRSDRKPHAIPTNSMTQIIRYQYDVPIADRL